MSIISTVPKGAAVEGINPNLLRNWYFVGGGTGRGVFPVNSRGVTSASATSEYFIDGWTTYGTYLNTYQLLSSGFKLTGQSNNISLVWQYLDPSFISGKTVTYSVLTVEDGLATATDTITLTSTMAIKLELHGNNNRTIGTLNASDTSCGAVLRIPSSDYVTYVAVKLELGDQQTLCHQENGVWVLNEIPDYEEEYYRCITNDVHHNDTYANQKVSNITVQCNSVGSSSLRYYNNLIQSTHKVLDSTFSNPAAQTSDITVTTYDGYLDFSNGFASGATTNITLVLGTSGPVLSTSTTAPS